MEKYLEILQAKFDRHLSKRVEKQKLIEKITLQPTLLQLKLAS